MLPIDAATFEELVSQALDGVPPELMALMQNVVVLIADEPPVGEERDLLGLYEGIPLTSRGAGYTFVLPDKITLFKNPILAVVATNAQLYEQIKRTLWHEIAHYYGLNHDRIDYLQSNHSS